MSKAEMLCEIPKLTPEERDEIRQKLDEFDAGFWLDADDPVTSEDKALLEARLADMEQHPEKSVPWADAEARLMAQYGERTTDWTSASMHSPTSRNPQSGTSNNGRDWALSLCVQSAPSFVRCQRIR